MKAHTQSTDRKPLPTGEMGFAEMRRQNCYLVDKSMFLYEVVYRGSAAQLILCPRHSGKTLNLDMLRQFLTIGGDPSLFQGLAISQHQDFCAAHQGKHPVLYLNLQSVDAEDYDTACGQLAQQIVEIAQTMPYLADSEKLQGYDRSALEQILHLSETLEGRSDAASSLKHAFRRLVWLMKKHFGKSVVVLVDGYDVPLSRARSGGYAEQMNDLVHDTLHMLLKGNDNVDYGVVMGCLRLPRAGDFSGLNNLDVRIGGYDFRGDYFSFSEDEVSAMLQYYGIPEEQSALRNWYGRSASDGSSVYNPQEVLHFVERRLAGDAWDPQEGADPEDAALMKSLLSQSGEYGQRDYIALMAGETVQVYLGTRDLAYSDRNFDNSDGIRSRMLLSGILSAVKCEDSYFVYLLSAASRKVRWQLATSLQDWLRSVCGVRGDQMERFQTAVQQGEADAVQSVLQEILSAVHAVLDLKKQYDREKMLYSGVLLGLLPAMWILQAAFQLDNTGAAISLQTDDGQGIVLALRDAGEGTLQDCCSEAMQQIAEHRLAETLLEQGSESVLCCGIAVQDTACMVKLERRLKER